MRPPPDNNDWNAFSEGFREGMMVMTVIITAAVLIMALYIYLLQ